MWRSVRTEPERVVYAHGPLPSGELGLPRSDPPLSGAAVHRSLDTGAGWVGVSGPGGVGSARPGPGASYVPHIGP